MGSQRHRTTAFAPFVELFDHLGWNQTVVPGSHTLFSGPGPNLGIMLPLARRGRIPAYYIPVVGRTLDEWGVLGRDEVERRLTPAKRSRISASSVAQ